MPLPIHIENLFTGRTVEWERLEFKEGWNPVAVLHTMCAFANDINNWGGGYLVIGVAERNGQPILPPKGLDPEQIDAMQKKLVQLGNLIRPSYHPVCEPVMIQGRQVLVIWVSGGDYRPYKAPRTLSAKTREWAYYIRRHSSTVLAQNQDEQELISLANKIPFDDRQNTNASVDHLQIGLMMNFLTQVGSSLKSESGRLTIEDLGRRMQVVRGTPEAPRPVNVGLLFFTYDPSTWFPCTQIDVVYLPKGRGGDQIVEKIFKGPLSVMLREALDHLRNSFVVEHVRKHPDRAEAERYFNVPYAALEEALVNAVYHRGYDDREPIEVQITPEEVTIHSVPGPDRSVSLEALKTGRAAPKRYRNRRIGEFLKELELCEGRGTGISKIIRALEANGSAVPTFETDEARSAFMVRIAIRSGPEGGHEATSENRDWVEITPHVEAGLTPHVEGGPVEKVLGGLETGLESTLNLADENDLTPHVEDGLTPHVEDGLTPHVEENALARLVESGLAARLIERCRTPQDVEQLLEVVEINDRKWLAKNYLQPLLHHGWIALTIPEKPRSPKQQYQSTQAGLDWLGSVRPKQ